MKTDSLGRRTENTDVLSQETIDHEQAEETLRNNERRLRHAQELLEAVTRGTRVIIAAQDTDLRYTFFNQAYQEEIKRLTGRDIQVGTSMSEVFAAMPEQQKIAVEEWSQALRGATTNKRLEFGDPEHHRRVYDILHTPIRDAQGNIVGAGEVAYDVTERAQAREALQQSEAQLRSLYASMTEGVALHEMVYDENGRATDYTILEVNPAYEAITGLPKDRAIGRRASELYGIGQPPYLEVYSEVAASGQPAVFETYFAPMEKHFRISVFSPGRGRFATVFTDITDPKRTEEALRVALEKYRVLFESFPLGITVSDWTGQIVESNKEAERLLGVSQTEHSRRSIGGPEWRIIRPDGSPMPAEEYASVRALRESRLVDNVEMGIIKEGNKTTWINVTAAPIPLERYGVAITYSDITERKLAEKALQRYTDRLRMLHEAVQAILAAQLSVEEIAIAAIRHVPQLLDCVRVCVMLYDHEVDEASLLAVHTQGETRLDKGWCGPLYSQWAGMLDTLQQGQIYAVEDLQQETSQSSLIEALAAEGVRAYVQVPLVVQGQLVGSLDLGMRSPGPLSQEQNEIAMEIATQVAIGIQQARLHEQVQHHADRLEGQVAERTAALRASEARFRAVFEDAAIGIALMDLQGRYTATNVAFQRMLGYSDEELCGLSFAQVTYPQDLAADKDLFEGMVAGERDSYRIEKRYVRRDGQVRWANRVASLVRDAGGTPQYAISMTEDITERKQALDALLWTEKLAVAGRLAASLTHEINNPLQSVMGCLALANEALTDGGNVSRYIEVARGELRRVASTVAQLRDLQRQPVPGPRQPTDIEALVQKVLTLTKNQCATNHVEVDFRVGKGMRPILLSADQVQQVFLNLVLNALDAMPDGGRLQVNVTRTRRPAGMRVIFADTGKGIAEKDLPRLFEPFYSTKSGGLGLGLFISRGIIEQHEGHIDVSSREGKGATFRVWLPAEG